MSVEVVVALAALVVSVMALTFSSMLSWRQLRSLRNANHLPVAIELLTRDMGTGEFQASERFLIDGLAGVPPDTPVSQLPAELRAVAYTVTSFYDSMGVLVVFDCVEERLALSTVNFRIRRIWRAMQPYILAERRLRGALYLDYLEDLACRAYDTDPAALSQQLRLRTMPPPEAVGRTSADRPLPAQRRP